MSRNPLQHIGYIALPAHSGKGGFDHAAVHASSGHVYVAHTANDALDVFDPASERHLFSVPGLAGVAGVLVSDESQLIIASARAEDTIGIFAPSPDPNVLKIAVGVRPNGLAYDPKRGLILVANVGEPAIPGSCTLSVVALDKRKMVSEIPVAGRTRWALYDSDAEVFYVNICDPPQIVIVEPRDPRRVARVRHSGGRPAWARPGFGHASALLRLRCANPGHARCPLREDHESTPAQRGPGCRFLQHPAPAALRRDRRSRGD